MNDHAELIDKFIGAFDLLGENRGASEQFDPIARQFTVKT